MGQGLSQMHVCSTVSSYSWFVPSKSSDKIVLLPKMCTLEPSVYFHIWLSLLKYFVTQLDTNLLFRRVINWRKRLQLKSGTGYITMTTSWTLMNNNQEVAVFVRQSCVCVCLCVSGGPSCVPEA